MTITEFLAALRETPRIWRLEPFGVIRGPRRPQSGVKYVDPCCPITGVADPDDPLSLEHYQAEAARIGLRHATAEKIKAAADTEEGFDPLLRSQLLDACDLKESA